MRKTKIVCTLGPAVSDKKAIRKLVLAGMDIARLNFSHGTPEQHRAYFLTIQDVSRELDKPIGVLQDLQGYKIRTGFLKGGQSLPVEENDSLFLVSGDELGEDKWVSISYPELYRLVKPGERIFIDDGKIELQVIRVSPEKIETRVIIGGLIGERKGVHISGANLEFPSLIEKDISDIQLGIELGVDYLAQSFVRQSQNILTIKDILRKQGAEDIAVLAKIEDGRGVENIEEIIEVSDGIMIARGDMGVCLPRARVPLVQKMIIEKCNRAGKPVITATQMLESMIRNHIPTRAEVSDVANAIIEGTDLVMLSGETAIGRYPERAVKEMHQIAITTEASIEYENLLRIRGILPKETISESVALAVRELAQLAKASVIMAFTLSGHTARIIAKYRPRARILAVTPNHFVSRQLLLYWGVEVMVIDKVPKIEEHFEHFLKQAINENLISKGEVVVLTSGIKKASDKPSGTIKLLST